MTTLSTRELTVRHNGQLVLDDISFSAKGGEFVAVIGANGAGKSTLLAALAGVLRFSSRAVSLNGISLRDLKGVALATHCAYLPQNPVCESPVSVERLMAFGLTPMVPLHWGLPESFESKIDAALEAVARHATRILALKAGRLIADGPVDETLTPELLRVLFGVEACVARTHHGTFLDYAAAVADPALGTPLTLSNS